MGSELLKTECLCINSLLLSTAIPLSNSYQENYSDSKEPRMTTCINYFNIYQTEYPQFFTKSSFVIVLGKINSKFS